MRPFARSGRSVSLPDDADFELVGEHREHVAAAIGPFLKGPDRLEEALQRTEDAIRQYKFWKAVDSQVRPGKKAPIAKELKHFSRAAAGYVAAAAALSEEAKSRVSELWNPACPSEEPEGFELLEELGLFEELELSEEEEASQEEEIGVRRVPSVPRYGYPADPERINASLQTAALVAGSTGFLADAIAQEKLPRGAPRNEAAYALAEFLADIWLDLTGRTLEPEGGDLQREGNFSRYFRAAIQPVEPSLDGRHHTRETAKRRRIAEDK